MLTAGGAAGSGHTATGRSSAGRQCSRCSARRCDQAQLRAVAGGHVDADAGGCGGGAVDRLPGLDQLAAQPVVAGGVGRCADHAGGLGRSDVPGEPVLRRHLLQLARRLAQGIGCAGEATRFGLALLVALSPLRAQRQQPQVLAEPSAAVPDEPITSASRGDRVPGNHTRATLLGAPAQSGPRHVAARRTPVRTGRQPRPHVLLSRPGAAPGRSRLPPPRNAAARPPGATDCWTDPARPATSP